MLDIEKLQFSIGKLPILNGITFSVAKAERLGVIGPNGSGKTTLFNCLSGFNLPDSGSIKLAGQDITQRSASERATMGLGRVFQNFGIFKEMSLAENIITALESRQSTRRTFFPWSSQNRANRASAMQYLEEVGLAAKADEKAANLSGGQMRLLEIVRTLAFGAEVFLLDEPTAGVSPKMKDEIAGLIERLHALGKTVLVIEHDINFIQKFCDRIVVLDQGRVVLDDTPQRVRESKLLAEIYFGSNTGSASRTAALTAA